MGWEGCDLLDHPRRDAVCRSRGTSLLMHTQKGYHIRITLGRICERWDWLGKERMTAGGRRPMAPSGSDARDRSFERWDGYKEACSPESHRRTSLSVGHTHSLSRCRRVIGRPTVGSSKCVIHFFLFATITYPSLSRPSHPPFRTPRLELTTQSHRFNKPLSYKRTLEPGLFHLSRAAI